MSEPLTAALEAPDGTPLVVPPSRGPKWLQELRSSAPDVAKSLESDQRRVKRLDVLLTGIADDESKAILIRLAYNAGLEPDDPTFLVGIAAIGLQKLVNTVHNQSIEDAKKLLEAANTHLRSVQTQHLNLSAQLAQIDDTLAGLPKELSAIASAMEQNCKVVAERHAEQAVTLTISEQARLATVEIETRLQTVKEQIAAMDNAFKPAVLAAQRLSKQATIILGGLQFSRITAVVVLAAFLVGSLLGGCGFGWLINATGLGLTPAIQEDVRAGRTYRALYPSFPPATKAFIHEWVARQK